jgi:rhodanese-related sulfurtransferase
MTAFHVRRDKAALYQWVQAPPGDRSSRKRPWCVLSFEAVALLRNKGYRARRLEDGFPEWKMAGLPVS